MPESLQQRPQMLPLLLSALLLCVSARKSHPLQPLSQHAPVIERHANLTQSNR